MAQTVDGLIVTAIEHRNQGRTPTSSELLPAAEAVVFGVTSLAIAVFPDPVRATLGLLVPGTAEVLTIVLTWGLVVTWVAYVVRLAALGRLRA